MSSPHDANDEMVETTTVVGRSDFEQTVMEMLSVACQDACHVFGEDEERQGTQSQADTVDANSIAYDLVIPEDTLKGLRAVIRDGLKRAAGGIEVDGAIIDMIHYDAPVPESERQLGCQVSEQDCYMTLDGRESRFMFSVNRSILEGDKGYMYFVGSHVYPPQDAERANSEEILDGRTSSNLSVTVMTLPVRGGPPSTG